MKLINLINKPEYAYQPKFILKKLFGKKTNKEHVARLSWGDKIKIRPSENIGKSIFNMGVYDLAVTETIYRVCNPGDSVIDAGANIGYTTLLMLHRLNNKGIVNSFEPHPYIFKKLQNNLLLNNYKNFKLHKIGLSNKQGTANLVIPKYFNNNEGISYIGDKALNNDFENLNIDIDTLDDLFLNESNFRLLKIDVEGHELKVLEGARKLLSAKKIENILFECNHENNSIINYLKQYDYTVYRLDKTLFKLKLSSADSLNNNPHWEPINYIATLNTEYTKSIFKSGGYKCLNSVTY